MDADVTNIFKDELVTCLGLTSTEADRVIKVIPAEIQALRLSAALRSKRIYDFHISKKAAGLKGLLELLTLESLIFYQKGRKEDKFKQLLREHVSLNDKVILLSHFTFSEPYKFKTSRSECKHLMYEDFLKDKEFRENHYISEREPEHCSFNLCYCHDWINERQPRADHYVNMFAERLIEMRNAFAHESFPILLLPSYDGKEKVGSFNSTMTDCYPLREEKEVFRSYECSLDPDIYFRITKDCMRSFVKKLITK